MINEEKLNVKIFKLTSGENVVATLLHETTLFFVIANAVNVDIDYSDEDSNFAGNVRFAMSKWIPFVEEGVSMPLSRLHVIGYSDINDEFKQFYINTVLGPNEEVNQPVQQIQPIQQIADTELEFLNLDNFDIRNKIAH